MYKVFRKCIPEYLIDNLLYSHEKFKYSKLSFFRAQGTDQFEIPKLDKFNNQINSIHNPHLLGFSKDFRKAHESIIFHKNISNALQQFSGERELVHWQSMFFDRSTATKLHQDTWYLDTKQRGKLMGVWFALEDIKDEAGPFVIYKNTDKRHLNPDTYDFNNLENDKNFKKDFPNSSKYRFLAKKGDILIWDSFSIHGADQLTNPIYTRKSVTSHYYPKTLSPNNPPIKRIYSIYNHKTPKKTNNKNIYKAAIINPYFYSLICAFLYFFKPLKSLLVKGKLNKQSHKKLINIRNIKIDELKNF